MIASDGAGGGTATTGSRGVQQRDPAGPPMFCLSFLPELGRLRADFEGKIFKALADMYDITLGLRGVTASMVRTTLILREFDGIGVVVNPTKTCGATSETARSDGGRDLTPGKWHRNRGRGGGGGGGHPYGTEEYVVERAE